MGIGIITQEKENGFKRGIKMNKLKDKISRIHQFTYMFFKLDLDEFVNY